MNIQTIYANPKKFEIVKLTGGYLGGAEKVTELDSNEKYVLKPMGDTAEQITHSLELLEHIKGFGQNFENMAKVYDWEVNEKGILMALFEFIENTADRLPTIPEMIQISHWSFLASKQYDHTDVNKFVDFQKTVLFEITRNGIERYSEKYFLPHVNDETCEIIDWLAHWAQYFITDAEFQREYLECVGFVHRDIHRHNIIINQGGPYLIDFDFSGVDCRLIEITRPTNVYVDVEDFLPMYRRAKAVNIAYFTATEQRIIDRVLVLDIMANLGWEVKEIFAAADEAYRNEIVNFLQPRLACFYRLMKNRDEFSLDYV